MSPAPRYCYPGRMGRTFLSAVDEILGQSERLVLFGDSGAADRRFAGEDPLGLTYDRIAQFQSALIRSSGERAGRGLSHRIGRAFSKYMLHDLGAQLGLEASGFRLLPSWKRIRTGLDLFAGAFNEFTDQHVRLEEDRGLLHWSVSPCPFCIQMSEGQVSCDWMVGFLQEAMSWLSGGKFYLIAEEKCIVSGGGACTIGIDPTPLVG